jgi:aldehyde dehydrogenase (NAD+)
MGIAKISFTGSAAAGRQVQIAAAKSNLKHVSLELGGKSASIVFNDANLENAVGHNSQGFLMNSGQVCVAGSRILVQSGIAPKFIKALKAAFVTFSGTMADPALESTYLGPLADKAQFDRVMGFLADAKKEGLQMLTGGVRKGEKGQFVEPTVILNPDASSKVYTDEIFGPVVTVNTFETEEDAIAMANKTSYGLGGKPETISLFLTCCCKFNDPPGSNGLHQRHNARPPRLRGTRSRHRLYQHLPLAGAGDAVRRQEAERIRP